MIFVNPKSITINQRRWDITITVMDADGNPHEYIASADSFFTEGDHIWFGDRADYEDTLKG